MRSHSLLKKPFVIMRKYMQFNEKDLDSFLLFD